MTDPKTVAAARGAVAARSALLADRHARGPSARGAYMRPAEGRSGHLAGWVIDLPDGLRLKRPVTARHELWCGRCDQPRRILVVHTSRPDPEYVGWVAAEHMAERHGE